MYNNIWTISNIMQFIFFSVLYLASVIDNAVDRVIDKFGEKRNNKQFNQFAQLKIKKYICKTKN